MAGRNPHGATVRLHRYVALVVAIAGPASAGLIPGGGPTASDCYVELDVAAIENGTDAVKRNKKVLCTDGDPCDFGPCGDGVCDFKVRLCWNQNDPNVGDCAPPPALDKMLLKGPLAAQLVMPREMGGAGCSGDQVDFAVPTRNVGKKPGWRTVRLSATAPEGTEPRADFDRIRLVCKPRPFEECPMPTPTTVPGATTTTTTVVETPTTTVAGPTTTITPTTSTSSSTRKPPRTTTSTTEPRPTTTGPKPTTTSTTEQPTTTSSSTSTSSSSTEAPTTTLPTTTTTTEEEPTTTVTPTTGIEITITITLPLIELGT